jgi:hypothetical protein
MPNPSLCCDCSEGGTYCVIVNGPCGGDPTPGQTVTVTGPFGSGYSATFVTDVDGKFCFTPPTTGSYLFEVTPSGVTAADPIYEYQFLFASQSGTGYLSFPLDLDSTYWCPCGCGVSAKGSTFSFDGFGQTVGATWDSGSGTYFGEMVCDRYQSAVPDGETITVGFVFNPSTCNLSIQYDLPANGGVRNFDWSGGAIGVITCEPFNIGTTTGNDYDQPSGDFYWPGPVPTGIRFYEI